MTRRLLLYLTLVLGLLGAACASDESADDTGSDDADTDTGLAVGDPVDTTTTTGTGAYAGHASEQYGNLANWLCHPDQPADQNVCARDLDATVIRADGTTEVEEFTPAEDPPVDCFYVYPTISLDPSANSDLVPAEDQEIRTVLNQAARLGEVCRVFAPVYRQIPLGVLTGGVELADDAREIAYGDVLDAWKQYQANDNGGRGVVLVGHSQGAGHLNRLIQEEIDTDDAQRERLVAAHLLGSAVAVPEGADVGLDFQNVPACRAADQTGCVVSYASFRSTSPPPAESRFGRPRSGEGVALCTNPAALGGGPATLAPYFAADDVLPSEGVTVETDWVTFPDFLEGECVSRDGFTWLEVTVMGDPADPRADDIAGDLTPDWGLHLVDANLAMGDLVELARAQADAYSG